MADVITESQYISLKFPLIRGDEETVRTINIPNSIDNAITARTALNAIKAKYSNVQNFPGFEYMLQPSNWRDTDDDEEAWQLKDWNEVELEMVYTSKTTMTPSE